MRKFQLRTARSGGSPREGVRSEVRAEQRLAAGGAAPPTRTNAGPWNLDTIVLRLRGYARRAHRSRSCSFDRLVSAHAALSRTRRTVADAPHQERVPRLWRRRAAASADPARTTRAIRHRVGRCRLRSEE